MFLPPDTGIQDYSKNPLQAIRQRALPNLQRIIGSMNLAEVKKRLS